MTKARFRSRKGNAMIEFGLSAPLIFTMLFGTFQFGYSFYVYNQLQTSVRSAVRFGSIMEYSGPSSTCAAAAQTRVRNVVVYGSPTPGANAGPIVRGLSTSNVNVSFNPDSKGVPTAVDVSVSNFSVNALFTTFSFNLKPWASVPYTGRYAPVECL